MLNQYAVDIPTLPINLCLSHLIQFLMECLAVLEECRAAEMGRQVFGTRMENRETLLQIQMHHHQLLILKNCIHGDHRSRSRFIHPVEKSERPEQNQDLRCQSGWRRLFQELWSRPTTTADF